MRIRRSADPADIPPADIVKFRREDWPEGQSTHEQACGIVAFAHAQASWIADHGPRRGMQDPIECLAAERGARIRRQQRAASKTAGIIPKGRRP